MPKSKTTPGNPEPRSGDPVLPNSPVYRLLSLLAKQVARELAGHLHDESANNSPDSVKEPPADDSYQTES